MFDPRPTQPAAAPDATAGVAALIAYIGSSQILTRADAAASWAPPGYDETDIRILEWIGSHRPSPRRLAA